MIGKTQNYTGIVPEAELYASSNQGQGYKQAIETLLSEGVNVINASAYFEYKYVGVINDNYPTGNDHYLISTETLQNGLIILVLIIMSQ